MKRSKWLTVALTGIVLAAFTGDVYAQKGRSGGSSRPSGGSSRSSGGSSKPSSGGSSRPSSGGSSRPSGGSSIFGGSSKPSSGGSSKPSSGSSGIFGGSSKASSPPASTPPSSGPKFGSPSTGSTKPATGGSQKKDDGPKFGSPSTGSTKPGSDQKFGSPNSTPKGDTPKFGSPNTSGGTTPPAGNSPQTSSSKPPTSGSAKAQAQKREESKKAYAATQKATAPPKSTATVNGQTVKVDTGSKYVSDLRSKPSTYIAPAARRTRYETHIHTYHYAHPYDYYYGRPVSYGIGPYSNAFWWMMMEWSAERRAQWLYHHQSELSAQAYADALRDQEVQRRLAALESQKLVRNASYVDSEFASDPSDMYDQNYVEAAYNPTVVQPPVYVQRPYNGPSAGSVFKVLGIIVLVVGGVLVVGYVLTKVKVTD